MTFLLLITDIYFLDKLLSCIYNFHYTGYSGFGVGCSVLLSRIDEYGELEI